MSTCFVFLRIEQTRLFDYLPKTISGFLGIETIYFHVIPYNHVKHVKIGVPQGSKLGPLSFIIYINDVLKLDFIGQLVLYADDAAILYAVDTEEQLRFAMQHDMDLLHDWLNVNVLSLNVGKTCFMLFGRARHIETMDIVIDGSSIKRVNKFKYLGLVIDEELNFHEHVNHVKRQITPFISLMWRKSKFIPVQKRKSIYFAYVQSHLLYMLTIYGDCAMYKLKELQTLQNRCIKAIFRLDRYTSTTYLYSSGLLPVTELVKVERIINLHKYVRHLTKHNFHFQSNAAVHGRSMRRASAIHNFNMYSSVTSSLNSSNAALVTAINDYNCVESEIRNLPCMRTFKAKVRQKVMRESETFSPISPFVFVN